MSQQLINTAKRLLKEKGERVTFFDGDVSDRFDPITGEAIASLPTIYPGFAYPSRYMTNDVDGEVIQSSDIRLVTERIKERPEKGWRVEVDNIVYRVMDVQHIRQSGADIIYICQIRAN